MRVVRGFDDAMSGWLRRLAQTSESITDRWNFTSDTLSRSLSLSFCVSIYLFIHILISSLRPTQQGNEPHNNIRAVID